MSIILFYNTKEPKLFINKFTKNKFINNYILEEIKTKDLHDLKSKNKNYGFYKFYHTAEKIDFICIVTNKKIKKIIIQRLCFDYITNNIKLENLELLNLFNNPEDISYTNESYVSIKETPGCQTCSIS